MLHPPVTMGTLRINRPWSELGIPRLCCMITYGKLGSSLTHQYVPAPAQMTESFAEETLNLPSVDLADLHVIQVPGLPKNSRIFCEFSFQSVPEDGDSIALEI